MIPLLIIRKILFSFAPIFLFYLLRKMGNKQQPKRKSPLFEFDKSRIVEGEIVDESSSNR
ncbi:MAG: hypothetical protein Q8P89_04435 [bacterium]|nr:hypothetical protein [bacterium]